MIKVCIALCIVTIFTVDPPVWPDVFEIKFEEQTLSGKTSGKIIYDAKNNRQVVERANGHHDRYCMTIQKLSNTPCNHIVVDGKILKYAGKRYLDFPAKKYCCYCCNSEHGCGITKKDWMENATYLGLEKLDNQSYQKWEIKGGQSNYYYNTHDDKRIPKKLLQAPNDNMDFNTNSYTLSITDQSVFDVPSYCNHNCGPVTICAALRGETVQQSIEIQQ